MIREGQIVLFRFPQTDQAVGKLRPALILRKLPGRYDDWLICMISSNISQHITDFDEVINLEDSDFNQSGLRNSSVVRVTRLAVVEKSILLGSIGEIASDRLTRLKNALIHWIRGT